ncbi:putative inactive dehydrogenase EasA [Favolaschia claudopus]|uniref:Inactive dehydrogenase EasA n=1 Tax=Favolaschia claudopus TaxID=2862362 RepID=A0AAW0AH36_9AGAR
MPKLFEPITVGSLPLQHRVVLAPMTRYKADKDHVPFMPLVAEHYAQRASRPGSLLITEATFIAHTASGYAHVPGIWSQAQIKAWKEVTDVVHAKGSFIFLQLWALGRAADYQQLRSEDPSLPHVAPSNIPLPGHTGPLREMTVPEIKEYVGLYAQAAKNAIEAGFDGVEVHGANGYLPDQFLQDMSNKRTDAYGGSVENRARFVLEVIDAVANAIGAQKTAIRFSPWSPFQEMLMKDPIPTFSYVISELAKRHPSLAYLHLVEPRINGPTTDDSRDPGHIQSNDVFREAWGGRPLIRAGGFTREGAIEAGEKGDLVAFGRFYTSNPDLPTRLEKNIELAKYDRATFFLAGENGPRGYTDQAFSTSVSV